ncbi:MAG: non-homologous end-joining DNA ligase, partial [Nocardioides sp.]
MVSATTEVAGRRLRVTNLDKVVYPATGTTKAEVIAYYLAAAPHLLGHIGGRIVTRKRWVEGVGSPESATEVFFEKNLPTSAPDWIRRVEIRHRSGATVYPVFASPADLAWAGQVAALELHVPQWRVGADGSPMNPDRFVLDLDPGPGVGLAECVEVAHLAREMLADLGMEAYPVTSGSKGLHLYSGLDGRYDSDYINAFARQFADALGAQRPDLVVTSMKKSDRVGKVLVDWSQNNGNKTTIAPYSLRGTFEPFVAMPRSWDDLDDPDLRQVSLAEALTRLQDWTDPMATLAQEPETVDKLTSYRAKRDASRTPEPVPAAPAAAPATGHDRAFVIQEHHASRLHWDFRLEHDGVLVSWALP